MPAKTVGSLSREGWGEGARSLHRLREPPHPNPLPNGEREFTEFAARSWAISQDGDDCTRQHRQLVFADGEGRSEIDHRAERPDEHPLRHETRAQRVEI